MSGWTAYTKIDQLMFLPMQSLALSATTFVGQNLGAGDTPRAQQGVRRALGISLAVTAVLMVPVLVFAPQLTAFFNRKAEVVAYGTLLLRYISPFFLLCCINRRGKRIIPRGHDVLQEGDTAIVVSTFEGMNDLLDIFLPTAGGREK